MAIATNKQATPTQERINLRLRPDTKQKIERAASFEGKNVSQFILASALSHAEKTIQEHEVITLNALDSEAFFNALTKPVKFNTALTNALKLHDQKVICK